MANDMTSGSIARKLIRFSVPMVIGSIFQQIYNIADSAIVGKSLGSEPFAAISLTSSITIYFVGMLLNICIGFGIPVAQDFGAKDEAGVRRCIANSIVTGLAAAVLATGATVPLTRLILVWMDVPDELMPYAYEYLVWIFIGVGAQMMYNLFVSILRELGDSRIAMVFLIVCSALSIALDLLFINVFGMGVKGAAIATGAAHLLCALICFAWLWMRYPVYRLRRADMKINLRTVGRLLSSGVPIGWEFLIGGVGSILFQKAVNNLGTEVITVIAAANRLQYLTRAPLEAIGTAMTTFVSQNYGAKRFDRVRGGMKRVTLMLMGGSALMFCVLLLGAKTIVTLFVDPTQTRIIQLVYRYVLINATGYPLLSLLFVFRNALRGVGSSKAAMLTGVYESTARTLLALFIVPRFGFDAVCLGNVITWLAASAILVPQCLIRLKYIERMQMCA